MRTAIAAIFLFTIAPCFASSMAQGTKDLDDEIRATIIKEMSKMKRYEAASGGGNDGDDGKQGGVFRGNQIQRGNSREGCNMEVGSASSADDSAVRRRGPTPRRVVTVVNGSIIQQCN